MPDEVFKFCNNGLGVIKMCDECNIPPEKWVKPLQILKRIIDDCACANQESCILCPMNAECANELKDMGYAL